MPLIRDQGTVWFIREERDVDLTYQGFIGLAWVGCIQRMVEIRGGIKTNPNESFYNELEAEKTVMGFPNVENHDDAQNLFRVACRWWR